MRTAIILATAFIRTARISPDSDKCLGQLTDGFNNIAEFVKKNPDIFDLYWVDNTIEPGTDYDNHLLSTVENQPNLKAKKLFFENYYNPSGTENKGCGIIAIWRKVLPEIVNEKYEFIIHFEPRQEIKNFSFFETFIKKPGSYFKTMRRQPDARPWRKYFPPYIKREIWTGLFSCPPQILLDYANGKDLAELAENRFHIEGDLYNYIKKNNIPLQPLSYLGLYWHDNTRQRRYII